ncbi:MAG: dihydropteroate synthase [Pseudomonadota bacterium]
MIPKPRYNFSLSWGRWSLDLGVRPHVMGIINVTPDSFSDGGDCLSPQDAVAQGLKMVEDGADILDLGGESTRPGAGEVGPEEEMARVLPVIRDLARRINKPISIDTTKAAVAQAALEAGAAMINDISAGRFDPAMLNLAAQARVPIVLMHMLGRPRTMQDNPVYRDLMAEIKSFLAQAGDRARSAGSKREMIILDPGIGFGKTFDHNLILINRLRELTGLGQPLLVGVSRKAFLGRLLDGAGPKKRDTATAAAVALAAYNGADILRVHDASRARETLSVVQAVRREHA